MVINGDKSNTQVRVSFRGAECSLKKIEPAFYSMVGIIKEFENNILFRVQRLNEEAFHLFLNT